LGPGQPSGRLLGSPGPDGGYALTLAERFRDRLVLVAPEKPGDALAVGAGLAMKRAASFGRAPVVTDLEIAFTILGWLGDPPAALVEWRRRAVAGASRHYPELRAVVDAVPDEVLGRPLSEAGAAAGAWPW
ncbi:MAG: hypothetical protein ACRDY7_01770, partial [Acidimicrobiia bacterium]